MDEIVSLTDRLRSLTEQAPAARPDDVEHSLTDGYAHALALEGERRRLDERIHDLAGSAHDVGEVAALKARAAELDSELAELRSVLRGLAATL